MWLYWYIIIQEGPTIWKMLFSTSRDSKNYVLHNCIESCLHIWSCGFLPICNMKTDLHNVASDGWNIWDKNHAPRSPHSDHDWSFVGFFEGCVGSPVCNCSFLEVCGPGSPYINFKESKCWGKDSTCLVVCTTPAFWKLFLLFTYTVMLQEEIMRQLVCMKSCKFVRWATYRLVQDLFHHPYHLPTPQTIQPCSAHPIVQVVHRRAIFSMTVAWVTSVEFFLSYSRHPLLSHILRRFFGAPRTYLKHPARWAQSHQF